MNKDKLQTYALVAEIFGGIAVLFTLIVVVFEVRENTETLKASTYDSLVADMSNLQLNLSTDDTLSETFHISETQGRDALTPFQAFQRRGYFVSQFLIYERAFIQWKAGNLNEEGWERFHRNICRNSGQPGFEAAVGELIDRSTTISFREYRLGEC